MGETYGPNEEDVCAGLQCSTLEELVVVLLELDDFVFELPELEDFDLDLEELDFAFLELEELFWSLDEESSFSSVLELLNFALLELYDSSSSGSELDELRILLDEVSIECELSMSMMSVALFELSLSPQEYNRSAASQRRQSFLIIKSLLQQGNIIYFCRQKMFFTMTLFFVVEKFHLG